MPPTVAFRRGLTHLAYRPARGRPLCNTCGTPLQPGYALCFRCGQSVVWALYEPQPRLLLRWARHLGWRGLGTVVLLPGVMVGLGLFLWRVLLRLAFDFDPASTPTAYADLWHSAGLWWISGQGLLLGLGIGLLRWRRAVGIGWISGILLTLALAGWVALHTYNGP